MSTAQPITVSLHSTYGMVLVLASGIGIHGIYTKYRYSRIKKDVYENLFQEESRKQIPILSTYESISSWNVPDDGEGRISKHLNFADRARLILEKEHKDEILNSLPMTVLTGLVGGVFFPHTAVFLLTSNLISRILITGQRDQFDYSGIKDANTLLTQYKEMNKIYTYAKDASEFGIYTLLPLVAGRTLITKV